MPMCARPQLRLALDFDDRQPCSCRNSAKSLTPPARARMVPHMMKSWRCRLAWHTWQKAWDEDKDHTKYLVCKRCGKKADAPTTLPNLGLGG